MGLSIGQIAAGLSNSSATPAATGSRPGAQQPAASTGQEDASLFFREEPQALPRAGFGEGTVSGPVAALQSLNQTVEGVRQSTPTIQELRVQFQLNAARQRETDRATQREEITGDFFRRVESRVPDPAPQARSFVENSGEVAGTVENAQTVQRPEAAELFNGADSDPIEEVEAVETESPAVVEAADTPPPAESEPREVDFEAPEQAPPPPNTGDRNRIDVSV